jgi:hypothetical protein
MQASKNGDSNKKVWTFGEKVVQLTCLPDG